MGYLLEFVVLEPIQRGQVVYLDMATGKVGVWQPGKMPLTTATQNYCAGDVIAITDDAG